MFNVYYYDFTLDLRIFNQDLNVFLDKCDVMLSNVNLVHKKGSYPAQGMQW